MSEFDDASFKEYVKAQIAELDAVIAERDAEIERLKGDIAELRKKKGISSAGDGLTFNEKTGTQIEAATGKHHCTICLLKYDRRTPLKVEAHGWRCLLCPKYYSDPDRPEELNYDERGPGGWMA